MCVRSVCLLLQVALPCALYADAASQLCLKGGTNAEMAPQIDYTIKVIDIDTPQPYNRQSNHHWYPNTKNTVSVLIQLTEEYIMSVWTMMFTFRVERVTLFCLDHADPP